MLGTTLGDFAMLGTALDTVAKPRLKMADMLCYLNAFFLRCGFGGCVERRGGQSHYIFGCGALMPMELRRKQVRSDDRLNVECGACTALLSPMTPTVTLED